VNDARDIVAAKESKDTYATMNKPQNRVARMQLGNLPPGAEIIITLNMTLVASTSLLNSIFFKLPLESCSPGGIVVSLDRAALGDFLFEQEIHGLQPIANVTSNLGGECLMLYLHSLPPNGFFNIVRFGSEARPMWRASRPNNDANVRKAQAYTAALDADLGGTEMSNPLEWICGSPLIVPGRKRQLFLLTDGEDFDPDRVMELVTANRNTIRCFTIGIGHGADPGLVKGIANRTNGRYDFVYDGVDLRTKVMPHLEAAMAQSIENAEAEISGAAEQRVMQSPIQPLIPGNLATVFIQCRGVAPDAQILVSGSQDGQSVEWIMPIVSVAADANFATAVAKFVDSVQLVDLEQLIGTQNNGEQARAALVRQAVMISVRSGILRPWTSFVGVQTKAPAVRERPRVFVKTGAVRGYVCVELDAADPRPAETIVAAVAAKMGRDKGETVIELPGKEFNDFKDCQILSRRPIPGKEFEIHVRTFTGRFVTLIVAAQETLGGLKSLIHGELECPPDQQRLIFDGRQLEGHGETLNSLGIISGTTVHLALRLRGGGMPLIIAEVEPAVKQRDVSGILDGHSVEGCWLDADDMIRRAGLPARPELPVPAALAPDLVDRVLATVVALAILRKLHPDQRELWRLLEAKALKWLASITADVDWSAIVDTILVAVP
jgi:hypothetical protein